MTHASSDVRAAAADRAQRALADLARLDMSALSRLSLSRRDVDDRAPDRETAVLAAQEAGLGALLDETRVAARDYVIGAFDNDPFHAIGVDILRTRPRASLDDRIAVAMAVEDAMIAAVADPFLTTDVREALTTPFESIHTPTERGMSIPRGEPPKGMAISARSAMLALGVFVVVSLILAVLGYGIGLAGLGAAVAIVLVALVLRGRP